MENIFTAWLLWFIVAIALFLLELVMPAFVLVFFALGALCAAAVLLVSDIGFAAQVWIFILTSVASLLVLRRYAMKIFSGTQDKNDTDLAIDGPNGIADVIKTIHPGAPGRIKYRGSFWTAESDQQINEGEKVVVTGYSPLDKSTIIVAPLGEKEE